MFTASKSYYFIDIVKFLRQSNDLKENLTLKLTFYLKFPNKKLNLVVKKNYVLI